jgi:hypothetical protein
VEEFSALLSFLLQSVLFFLKEIIAVSPAEKTPLKIIRMIIREISRAGLPIMLTLELLFDLVHEGFEPGQNIRRALSVIGNIHDRNIMVLLDKSHDSGYCPGHTKGMAFTMPETPYGQIDTLPMLNMVSPSKPHGYRDPPLKDIFHMRFFTIFEIGLNISLAYVHYSEHNR